MSNKEVSSLNKFTTRPSPSKDLYFFEQLSEFVAQCTFFALQRRAFNVIREFLCAIFSYSNLRIYFIECELNRLLRTEFFNTKRENCLYNFGFREKQVKTNYPNVEKTSPRNLHRFYLVTAGTSTHWKTFGIKTRLWWPSFSLHHLNRKKMSWWLELRSIWGDFSCNLSWRIYKLRNIYRCNKYLLDLERNFSIPECHLVLIGKRCGILGDPKFLYDTMLNLNEPALREMSWNEDYDPYSLINRVTLKIQTKDDFNFRFENLWVVLTFIELQIFQRKQS